MGKEPLGKISAFDLMHVASILELRSSVEVLKSYLPFSAVQKFLALDLSRGGPKYTLVGVVVQVKLPCTFKTYIKILGLFLKIQ